MNSYNNDYNNYYNNDYNNHNNSQSYGMPQSYGGTSSTYFDYFIEFIAAILKFVVGFFQEMLKDPQFLLIFLGAIAALIAIVLGIDPSSESSNKDILKTGRPI